MGTETSEYFTTVDWAVVAGYLLLTTLVGHLLRGKQASEEFMHPILRITNRHGREGVAMVPPPNGQQALPFWMSPGQPVLEGDLDGHLDGDGSGITEECSLHPARREFDQSFTERYGRLVGESAEHHMGQGLELALNRLLDLRMAIPMDGCPP